MRKLTTIILVLVLALALTVPALAAPTTVYFFDTYGDIKDNPTIMWGDKGWAGWVGNPLNDEGGGWYSFKLDNGITEGYNMLIFFNGLPDEDANAVQWVWHTDRGAPAGVYFIADNSVPQNPNENNFKGKQWDAKSFDTKDSAEAALKSLGVVIGGDAAVPSPTPNPATSDSVLILIALGVLSLSACGFTALNKARSKTR